MQRYLVLLLLNFSVSPLSAQLFPPSGYPQGYFRNPLNIPISLAGNYGELRPNHYHMGLDIRTQKKVNLPVYAAADGYISRIKVEPAGFGQAIYINHPNGYTTLYAHLNAFYPALAAYVKQQQYKAASWRITLDIPPGMFKVKKGDFIALSGSTGGSQAPHVHFEIRKTVGDINLNPMLFGLPIPDHSNPVIQRLAIYDREASIYEQHPRIIAVRKTGNRFSLPGGLIRTQSPRIGFAISAFDTESGTPNHNGIFQAILLEKGRPLIGFQMDKITYENTRNINGHIDYKTKAGGGPFLQQLFHLPGYTHSIYQPESADGVLDLSDGTAHAVAIEVKDPYGNQSELRFQVQYKGPRPGRAASPAKMFYPQMLDGLENAECAIYIGESCLYDSVHIPYERKPSNSPGSVSAVHHIGEPYIPLQDSFLVRIKTLSTLTADQKNRVVMKCSSGSRQSVQKVGWQGDWASAKFRDFGNFQLLLDLEPPVIIPIGFKDGANLSKAGRIVFIIKDNLQSFKNFRAELDGNWLMFSNDKGKSFLYTFDEHCPRGEHQLKISVEDEAGNQTVGLYHFTR